MSRTMSLLCGAFVFGAAHGACAQSDSYFDRTSNVGVRDRPRPDYDALGLLLGSFQVLPSLTVSPEYDTNIFATRDDTQSDFITAIQPAIVARSDWSRHEVDAYARLTSDIYADHSEEDTTDYALGASGRLDILAQSSLSANASFAHSTIPRTAEDTFTNALKPVQYDTAAGGVGAVQTLNRLRFSESAEVTRIDYSASTDAVGQSLSLAALNNTAVVVMGRADYALSPAIALFTTIQGDNRDYSSGSQLDQENRSSSGYQVGAGADFDITQLVKGQFQLGYLSQEYKSNLFHVVSGPAIHGRVDYYLTDLTTLTLTADRTVNDAVDPTAISYLQTRGGFEVDHELLRNVILSGRFSYEDDDFRGVQRDDRRTSFSASGTYLLNRHMGLTAAYTLLDETSSGLDRLAGFVANVVSLSLVLQL